MQNLRLVARGAGIEGHLLRNHRGEQKHQRRFMTLLPPSAWRPISERSYSFWK